jgi:hypothetical protein
MNNRTQRPRGGYRTLSFQAEYIQENFRISGAKILVGYGERSAFLAMLQKVLPRCVVAGPRGTQERASPGWAFPRGLRVWRGAFANPRSRACWLGCLIR